MQVFNTPTSAFDPSVKGPLTILEESKLSTACDSGVHNDASRDGLLLTEALRTAQSAPDIRQDKVDAIRARIAKGAYEIDSHLIAAGLIRDELGL